MTLKCISGLNPIEKPRGDQKQNENERKRKERKNTWKSDQEQTLKITKKDAKKQTSLHSRKEFTTTTRDE